MSIKAKGRMLKSRTLLQQLMLFLGIISLAAMAIQSAIIYFTMTSHSDHMIETYGEIVIRSLDTTVQTIDSYAEEDIANAALEDIIVSVSQQHIVRGINLRNPQTASIRYRSNPVDENLSISDALLKKIKQSPGKMISYFSDELMHCFLYLERNEREHYIIEVIINPFHFTHEEFTLTLTIFAGTALVSLALAILVLYSFYRWFRRPLRILSEATTSISMGKLDVHVNIHVPREFEQFGEIFNRMVRVLRDQTEEMETRVRQRTLELETSLKEISDMQHIMIQQERLATIGQLSAGVAHEINNPAAYLGSNLKTLQEYVEVYQKILLLYEQLEEKQGSGFQEQLKIIEEQKEEEQYALIRDDIEDIFKDADRGIDHIMDIIKGLKRFARKDEENRGAVNINDTVNIALNLVKNRLKYHCEIREQLESVREIHANQNQITQVIVNLLVNAADAVESHGVITIRSFCSNNETVCLEVEDNGTGIAPEVQEKIFEPFYTTKDIGVGTGLGLSISRGIIKDHGGEIRISSQPGKGSVFRIQLPVFVPVLDTMEDAE